MFIGSTQTLDNMSCLLKNEFWPRKIASVRALNIAPFSNICDIVISFTNNTTEKLPDAKQSTAQHSDAIQLKPN